MSHCVFAQIGSRRTRARRASGGPRAGGLRAHERAELARGGAVVPTCGCVLEELELEEARERVERGGEHLRDVLVHR